MSETQRYRVNYQLLGGLVVGGLVAAVAAYLLWRFQVNRNATNLLARAEAAQASSDGMEALETLAQYLALRKDDDAARVKFGQVAAKLLSQDGLDYADQGAAYQALADSVTRTGDAGLRRQLVDFYMEHGAADRALGPIDELLDDGDKDPKLKAMRARALFANQRAAEAVAYTYKLIGYDQKTGKFDVAKAEAPDHPALYLDLAQYLFGDRKEDLAREMIKQMVVANPESRDAYLFQYQAIKRDDDAKARESLEKAYELDPNDANVLFYKGFEELQQYQEIVNAATADTVDQTRAEGDKRLTAAAEYFAEGRKKFPDRIPFYEFGARVALAQERVPEALGIIDEGLKEFDLKKKLTGSGIPQAIELVNFKIDVYFAQKDVDAIRREIKALRDLGNPKVEPLADYHAARVQLQEGKWMEAARQLETIKLRLIGYPQVQALAGSHQGICYLQLGQYDMAVQAFDWALDKNPSLEQAKRGRDEAASKTTAAVDADPLQMSKAVTDMLALPREQQDWDSLIANIDSFIDKQAATTSADQAGLAARKELLHAQLYATRAMAISPGPEQDSLFAEARKAITEAYRINPKDITVQSAAPRLLAMEPKSGPAEALKLLDAIVKKNGDLPTFRTLRIDLLSMMRDENFTNRVYAATEKMDDWTPEQQAVVWAAAGQRFEQLGQFQDAQTCMARAAELEPQSLQHRTTLFNLALKQGDDSAMRAAQEELLKIIKDEKDPAYVVNEVKRMMFNYANGSIDKNEMQRGRAMLDEAIKRRPSWAELYLTSGQLYLTLERNQEQALAAFDLALANGPANMAALNLQIRLLADLGRFDEARKKMDLVPQAAWPSLLDVYAANVISKVAGPEAAVVEAKRVAETRPSDPAIQLWYSEKAAEANQPEVAETAMRKAVELNPGDPDVWSRLLAYYVRLRKSDEVERVLREAQLALDEEFLPLLMAKQHELFGRFAQAESILLAYYGDKVDEPQVSRRMAEFYLVWSAQTPAQRDRAAVYINRLLRDANEGKLKTSDPHVAWARRQAARLLALAENYHDSVKAEQLLEAAIAQGGVAGDDQNQLVEILSLRGDPASRERAATLLLQMKTKLGGLTAEGELRLAQALHDLGDWEKCQSEIRSAIARFPNDSKLRVSYITWLLEKKELQQAEIWINRLRDVKEVAHLVPELQLRLAAAKGEKDRVRAMLTAMTPNLTAINAAQLRNLRLIALLATDVGDHEYALTLLREYVRRSKDDSLELPRMIALHGSPEEAVAVLRENFDGRIDDVLALAVQTIRARRSENPKLFDEEIDRLIRLARRDDPDSAQRMVLEAEALEVQERYEEAIAAYRALLGRDDVPSIIRTTAQNNLAFLLALQGKDLDDALTMVNGAIGHVGPISDILDTRGLVHLARGEKDAALADLKLSVKVGATASKYFHLAQALLAVGDKKGALAAWKEAELLGISPEKVSKLETDQLDKASKEMDAIRTSAA